MADENIRIRAELEGALSRDLDDAARSADALGDQAVETAMQLRVMEAAASGSSRELRDLDREAAQAERRIREIGRSSRSSSRDVNQGASALDRMQSMLGKFKGFDLGAAMKAYKIPAIVTALTLAATALSALGAAAVAAVAGIAPLAGLIGALPAGLAAAGQGLAVVKLGFSGMGEAVKALTSGDLAKAGEALAKLTPPAQRFATTLAGLMDSQIKPLKRAVAEGLFPGLTAGLTDAAGVLPVVRSELGRTAVVMGDLGAAAGRVIGSPMFSRELASIMRTNTAAIDGGGRAAGLFGLALVHVTDAAGPMLLQMVAATRGIADYVEGAARAGNESGRLGRFFQRSWELAQATGGVLSDLAVGIFNVGSNAGVMADRLGGGIERGAKAFRDWSSSVAGQKSIEAWFKDAIPVVDSMVRLVARLGTAFGNLATNQSLAPVIDQITNELVPALETMAVGVSTRFGPALVTAATAFVQFVDALSFSPLAVVLQVLAESVSTIAAAVTALPEPLRFVAASLLAFSLAVKVVGGAAAVTSRAFSPLTAAVSGMRAPIGAATTDMSRMEVAGNRLGTAFRTVRSSAQYGSAGLTGFARVAGTTRGAVTGLQTATRGMGAGLVGAFGGPWGLAITAGAAALGIFANRQARAKEQVDLLAGSLNQQTGAVTGNTRAVAAKALQDSGALSAAKALGLSLSTVTSAALGNTSAIRTVNGVVSESVRYYGLSSEASMGFSRNQIEAGKAAHTLQDALAGTGGDLAAAAARTRDLAAATATGTGATGRLTRAQQVGAAAINVANGAAKRAAGGSGEFAGQTRRTAATVADQTNKTKALSRALVVLHSETLKNMQGEIGFRQAVADANKAIKGGTGAMSLFTQKGRDNRSAMIGVANAAAGVTGSARKQQGAVLEARNKIQQWAERAGYGEDRARRFAAKIISVSDAAKKLPPKKNVDVSVTGTARSGANLTSLERRLANLPRQITIDVLAAQRYEGGGALGRFAGGPVEPGPLYRVGERGPELYAKRSGAVEVVGARGEELRRFTQPGVILPNDVYQRETAAAAAVAVAAPAVHVTTPTRGGGDDYVPGPPVTFQINAASDVDVVSAARQAYEAIRRDEETRRIRHAGFTGGGGNG